MLGLVRQMRHQKVEPVPPQIVRHRVLSLRKQPRHESNRGRAHRRHVRHSDAKKQLFSDSSRRG